MLIILGALMSLLAGIAVLRFPDTMSRIHAATKPQVLGIMLLMLGLGLRLGSPGVIGMLVLIVILQFVTAPVSAHLTVRVAFRNAKDEPGPTERGGDSAADDGPAQLAQLLSDESRTGDRTARYPVTRSSPTGKFGRMSQINDLSDAYVAEFARLSPMMRDLSRHAGPAGLPGRSVAGRVGGAAGAADEHPGGRPRSGIRPARLTISPAR